ncbi:hypothetical protein SEA_SCOOBYDOOBYDOO_204 [Mycobacterium phage ScoobyDoobyDoo]|nr:hypothetical protein SEA_SCOOBYDOOBYDOO_204 [Mycobacterium phage ScoobyDoobyDoo]
MSTEPAVQVPEDSVDVHGLSIVTATRTADEPRRGVIYNPDTFAAAMPIWFHPMPDGRFLGVFTERWYEGTVGDGGPQSYSSYTSTSAWPSLMVIDPATGATGPIQRMPGFDDDAGVFNVYACFAAASRFDYLFLVGWTMNGTSIRHLRVDPDGVVTVHGVEDIGFGDIAWIIGAWTDERYLYLLGLNTVGESEFYRGLCLRRKRWSRIGPYSDEWSGWEFKAARGWSSDPEQMEYLRYRSGDLVVTDSFCTYAQVGTREYLAVRPTTESVSIISKRPVDQGWRIAATMSVDEDAVISMQPELRYNPAALPEGKRVGVPYMKITDVDDDPDARELRVEWGLYTP